MENQTLFAALAQAARQYPDAVALDFMGKSTTYRNLLQQIHQCAQAFQVLGIRPGNRVTIALPNCPQAVIAFYAVNLAGGIANMIHPLSAEKEIEFYLSESESDIAITLDQFYHKFERVRKNTGVVTLIVARIADALSRPIRAGYMLTEGRKTEKIPSDAPVMGWKSFLKLGKCCFCTHPNTPTDRRAVILYSGGTTGTCKGIVLTNENFNALSRQIIAANPMFSPGDKMLCAMPLFHGFGLGVCIHTALTHGGRCVLMPRFTPESYAKHLVKHRCNFLAGVPTLYEALLRLPSLEGKDLRFLKGVFSGGDSLAPELKRKLDSFLQAHNAGLQIREGYGTTETVAACCLAPVHGHREGSIGLPLPGTKIKIVAPGTDTELPRGEEGEILVAGPTVMEEYLHHPEETARTLRTHPDGLRWLYTGDLGSMDADGFVYFRGRAKRMIVTSGYNVYPARLEAVLDAHPYVRMSCIIGVPDTYKMQKVKAFLQLQPGIPPTDATRQTLLEYCRRHIARYAIPSALEFRDTLPLTPLGKIAYRILEEEESP